MEQKPFDWKFYFDSFRIRLWMVFLTFPLLYLTIFMAILMSFVNSPAEPYFLYGIFGLGVLLQLYRSYPFFAEDEGPWLVLLLLVAEIIVSVSVIVIPTLMIEWILCGVALAYVVVSSYLITKTLQDMGMTSEELTEELSRQLDEALGEQDDADEEQ